MMVVQGEPKTRFYSKMIPHLSGTLGLPPNANLNVAEYYSVIQMLSTDDG